MLMNMKDLLAVAQKNHFAILHSTSEVISC